MCPTLDIDQFDDAPSVGDKVKVMGKIKSINEDSGEVEVSYDDVSIVNDNAKPKKKKRNYDNRYPDDMPMEMMPNTQTLDESLAQTFPNTQ